MLLIVVLYKIIFSVQLFITGGFRHCEELGDEAISWFEVISKDCHANNICSQWRLLNKIRNHMWRFVSFVAETITKPRLFECIARVTRPNVEVTKPEPNIRLIILFLLKQVVITLFMNLKQIHLILIKFNHALEMYFSSY